ncbi:MAG: phosphate acyltransferase [Bacteroidales bacterium]|nr:phosphate acyltransferase [Bacteroidales bacterium]
MRIGIDIMGGDYAPEATVSGAILALKEIPDNIELILFGEKESIIRSSDSGFDFSGMEIVETSESITMSDHPYKAFFSKKKSSIYKGFQQLRSGKIDAFCSAGNTGAMMIGATQIINVIPGIIRPSIAARIPNMSGRPLILLDVGLNPDSRPDVLYQYGVIGKIYAKSLFKIEDPKIGLVNIGVEEEKGNLASKAAYQLMKDEIDFNFVGNVEANEIFTDPRCNVLVSDGFVGNVLLKEAEGFYKLIKSRNINDDFFELFNFENFGGTPILGVCKPVVVGHGISNDVAIKNMILHTWEVLKSNLVENLKSITSND